MLFGLNNRIDKFFDADGISDDFKIILEVEAGWAYRNNQFLKDIFQACMMPTVEYLILAVRNTYAGTDDFESIFAFKETLYINGRLQLPLKGIVLIGYWENYTLNCFKTMVEEVKLSFKGLPNRFMIGGLVEFIISYDNLY